MRRRKPVIQCRDFGIVLEHGSELSWDVYGSRGRVQFQGCLDGVSTAESRPFPKLSRNRDAQGALAPRRGSTEWVAGYGPSDGFRARPPAHRHIWRDD
jgi:hypothetical protein